MTNHHLTSNSTPEPKCEVLEFVIFEQMAEAYTKLLSWIPWDDQVLVRGIREGLNKFLSNAYLKSLPGKKHQKTLFASSIADEQIRRGDFDDLVFEHLVPKEKIIQGPCEAKARERQLKAEFVYDLLCKYWVTATITKIEDDLLPGREMPFGWDRIDVFARYKQSGILLVPNPLADKLVPKNAQLPQY